MSYSKAQFISVLNAVRVLCVFENQSMVLRELISSEADLDTLKVLQDSLLENNCKVVDEIINLSKVLSTITGDESNKSIAKIIEAFRYYSGKNAEEPYNITVKLLNYYDYSSKEA